MRDKRVSDIIKEMRRFAGTAILTQTANDRSMEADALADAWRGLDGVVLASTSDPCDAYEKGRKIVAERDDFDALIVCGSLYLISDLMSCAASRTI
jgi:folylpolyglutamate synthase/dihydropteroate synthase